ncbi:DRTGG domain-containing protein [Vallitalea okinawensis]|uniref:DRTGG domain-containing protein n=1 Tax=Vallitalea okinawensis TaxID=2078660 RepID=UPI000CFE1113|nr:DRTGG domain-containing protein [Vallitalea okinawensis]
MTVRELVDKLDLKVIAGQGGLDKEIEGGFVGDLLSVVMGKAKKGDVWVTIQSHINIIAVATLVEISCIIISEGYKLDLDAEAKANDEDIPIITVGDSSYEMTKKLSNLGI